MLPTHLMRCRTPRAGYDLFYGCLKGTVTQLHKQQLLMRQDLARQAALKNGTVGTTGTLPMPSPSPPPSSGGGGGLSLGGGTGNGSGLALGGGLGSTGGGTGLASVPNSGGLGSGSAQGGALPASPPPSLVRRNTTG